MSVPIKTFRVINLIFSTIGVVVVVFMRSVPAFAADDCKKISEEFAGRWVFNENESIVFEPSADEVLINGEAKPMKRCSSFANLTPTFFIDNELISIQRQGLGGGSRIGIHYRFFSLVKAPIETNVSGSEPQADNLLVMPSRTYSQQAALLGETAFSRMFTQLAGHVDPQMKIVARECGVVNAFYSPGTKTLTICYEMMQAGEVAVDKQYPGVTPEVRGGLKAGAFMFIFLHELGHAMVHLRKIPILGGEEDAVDRFATVSILEISAKHPNQTYLMINGALSFWNAMRPSVIDKILNSKARYSDEHPITEQRIRNIACLAYGSNPTLYTSTAVKWGLTQERAKRCPNEYAQARDAINQLM